jgi:hypothetical protein
MFYPIVVLGTGFALEIGFVYLVNKAMTKLLTDGSSFCCPKRKNPSADIYTDRGGIAPVPEDDANDENEWNAQAEKQKVSETIYRKKEEELEELEKTPFEFDQKVTPTPVKRPVVKARPNGDARRRVPVKTKAQTSEISEAAQKQFLDSIKEEDSSKVLGVKSE